MHIETPCASFVLKWLVMEKQTLFWEDSQKLYMAADVILV
jgi:hypothetical protein